MESMISYQSAEVKVVKVTKKVAEIFVEDKKIGSLTYNPHFKILEMSNGDMFSSIEKLVEAYEKEYVVINVTDNPNTEWIVEQLNPETNNLRPIGKLIGLDTEYLSRYELEEIWNLANYNFSQPKKALIKGSSIYSEGYISDTLKHLVFVPLEHSKGVANCDILIRQHYELDKCFVIKHGKGIQDSWIYTDRKEALNFIRKKPWER